jgi:hypothetical protein
MILVKNEHCASFYASIWCTFHPGRPRLVSSNKPESVWPPKGYSSCMDLSVCAELVLSQICTSNVGAYIDLCTPTNM